MASKEAREAAIKHASEMVRRGSIWLRRASEEPSPNCRCVPTPVLDTTTRNVLNALDREAEMLVAALLTYETRDDIARRYADASLPLRAWRWPVFDDPRGKEAR